VDTLQTQLVALRQASTQGSSEAVELQQQLEAAQRACLEATAALEALEASSKAEVEELMGRFEGELAEATAKLEKHTRAAAEEAQAAETKLTSMREQVS
jgi:hypothetical protein